jgi:FkbH-like protein
MTAKADKISGADNSSLYVMILADCLAARRLEVLKKVASSQGITIDGVAVTAKDFDVIDQHPSDIIILYPWNINVLNPLWDVSAIIDEASRLERVEAIKDYLTVTIQAVLSKSSGRLILVQGLAGPPLLPRGRMEFRSEVSYRRILFEVNEHICNLIRSDPNTFFVDEERIFANLGKRQLLDYAPGAYVNYLGVQGYDLATERSPLNHKPLAVMAMEYLDIFRMWTGRGRIKCIITDLDNTLWPGEIGNGKQQINVLDLAMTEFGGLHEALKLAKEKGILLASCSKNTQENVIGPWAEFATSAKSYGINYILEPDDFVIHKINWERKSENVREIISMLGFTKDSFIFIDDHPVEREEIKQFLPEMTVLDSRSTTTRYNLLSDPRMEVVSLTQEAQSRTTMTKAHLRREEERRTSVDERSFLQSLRIKVRVTLVRTGAKLDRVAELIQRTHQFNTTQTSYDVSAIRAFLSSPDTELYTMEVADKFTNYGLVGVCLIRAGEIDTFVMSCRVLGLKVETVFLASVLRNCRWAKCDVWGRIVETPFNQPCRHLFLQSGFTKDDDGRYVCRRGEGLVTIEPSIYEVEMIEEAVGALNRVVE